MPTPATVNAAFSPASCSMSCFYTEAMCAHHVSLLQGPPPFSVLLVTTGLCPFGHHRSLSFWPPPVSVLLVTTAYDLT